MGIRQAVLVSGQSAVGVSSAKNWTSASSGILTVEVYFIAVGGVCTELTVALEGSIMAVNYFALASHTLTVVELAAGCCMFHIVDKPIKLIRSNITALTVSGGGSVAVTVAALSID
jgi:hypothetical protein